MISYDNPGLALTIFMTGSNLFSNASALVKAYTAMSVYVFPSFSYSAYPQHSGERYRTNGPLVFLLTSLIFE